MFSAVPRTARVLAVTCLLALIACTQTSAPTAPPTDMRASNEASVRADVEGFKSAIGRRDVERILSFFAEDGWQLPPNGPIARTAAERRAVWMVLANLPISQDAVDVADRIDIAESGDLAVQYGQFRQVMVDGKGNFKSLPQKFITSWRKQPDGSWKISASMASVEN
jgi:ketosteroid isomerase-like protein